jgi:aldehyde dehydrogenase (NAD+)
LIEKNAEQLGYLESILVGKPAFFGGMHEPNTARDLFRYFAGFCDKYVGEVQPDEPGWVRVSFHHFSRIEPWQKLVL